MSVYEKYNPTAFKDYLLKEQAGLEALREHLKNTENKFIKIPDIYSVNERCLLLQSIHSLRPTPKNMTQFGQGLALLHKKAQDKYGFAQDNYIGLSIQENGLFDNWGQFFIEKRLLPQISLISNPHLARTFTNTLHKHADKVASFLNQNCAFPSLLHGDLWSGNVLFDQDNVWLIDPAIYYGDREVDLAMTEMFGGFSIEFYQAYDEVFPRTKHYPSKRTIYNLYHYLNHYNLFGKAYFQECLQGFESLEKL